MKAPLYRLTVPSWGQDDSSMTEPSKLPHHGVPEHQPAAGGIAARARAAAGPALSQRAQSGTARRGRDAGRPGAGAGRRRNRQDPRADHADRAYPAASGRARPREILSVTFTNKAAREMKLRIGQMVGQVVEGMPWLGTFHAIGVKILRRHAELVGLKSNFTILDVDDQIRLLKQLLQAENIDEKRWPARMLRRDDRRLEEPRPDARRRCRPAKPRRSPTARARKLYAAYQERLKTLNAADFGDLLLENIRLFREHPDVLRRLPAPLQATFWSTSIRTPTSRSICGCGCWRRRRRGRRALHLVPLAGRGRPRMRSAIRVRGTVARSTPHPAPSAARSTPPSPRKTGRGQQPAARTAQKHLLRRRRRPVDLWLARRGGRQHPALRARLSRRQGDPPRTQLPLHRPHPRRRLASDRAQRRPARQDAAHRGRAGREGHRHRRLGFGRGSPRHRRGDRAAAARRRQRSTRSRSWCAPRSRCANSKIASSRSACPIA